MADETLISPVPEGNKVRTTDAYFVIEYRVVSAGGAIVGKRTLRFRPTDENFTPNQRDAIVNFAKQALQVLGHVA